ncbi:MAG: Ig domain-containing protein [Planctomycetota bacterium]|nr:Ig domain-containing protein [Planctomycetota bacterium]
MVGIAVSLSALDLFANAVGAISFLLLLFAANTIELVKQPPLRILTRRVPVSAVSVDYIAVLAATGGAAPYKWTMRSGSLPEGLNLDAERGEIGGVPTPSMGGQTFPFEVTVEDAKKHAAAARFEIRVAGPRRPGERQTEPLVLLTHGRLPDAVAWKPYEVCLSARGGSGRYRWSAEGMPEGFALGMSSGLLSGTAKGPGRYDLILRVEDEQEGSGDAGIAVATAVLEVQGEAGFPSTMPAPPAKIAILTRKLPPAAQSEPYEVALAGTGMPPLRWSAKSLPPWLHLQDDGLLSGTPPVAGVVQVAVALTDARSAEAAETTLSLAVNPRPVSMAERFMKRGLWGWLGYVLLILVEVACLYLLRRYKSDRVLVMLKRYNVELIRRPDGTSALNGRPEDTAAFNRAYGPMHQGCLWYQRISYALLALAMIAYTIFLLS